jgi:hypothetical protein
MMSKQNIHWHPRGIPLDMNPVEQDAGNQSDFPSLNP